VPHLGTPGPPEGPVTKGRPPIDPTSLFSAPEGRSRRTTAVSPPPTTTPIQAPDFGEDETPWSEDAQEPDPVLPTSGTRAARGKAA
jgi:hypothetical protein